MIRPPDVMHWMELAMSNEQLISAYQRGDLGRRQLVRKLVAGGVSLTAAFAYTAAVAVPAAADSTAARGGKAVACSHAGGVIAFQGNFHAELCGG